MTPVTHMASNTTENTHPLSSMNKYWATSFIDFSFTSSLLSFFFAQEYVKPVYKIFDRIVDEPCKHLSHDDVGGHSQEDG